MGDLGGRWITKNNTRIFIRDGESFEDALKRTKLHRKMFDKSKPLYNSDDLGDAFAEHNSGMRNSLSDYMNPDGTISPEREAIHRQIIESYFEGKEPVEGQAEFMMLGGGPASGKSSAVKSGLVPDYEKDIHGIKIDPDEVKSKLPGYAEMASQTDKAASFYHEESSMLAKKISEAATTGNFNVTYDGTGDGSIKSVMSKVNGAREKGYKVTANYVTVNTQEALARNRARYEHQKAKGEHPRLVPDEQVISCHAKVTSILSQVAPNFDEVRLFDNNVPEGQNPRVIAVGGNGNELTPISGYEQEFKNFKAKANALK